MSTLRLSLVATSLLLVGATACAPSEAPPTPSNAALSDSQNKDGSSSSDKPAGSTAPGGGTAPGSTGTPKPTATDNEGPCGPLIGKWTATFDDGAEASGDDVPLGQSVGFTGKMDFTLTHDDADLPNIVDFAGTATIDAVGQTQTYQMQPSTKASGDTKDTTCAGGLHIKGITNVDLVGDIIFTMDGDFDGTSSPANSGHANFTIKTADDDGKALTGKGTAKLVRQQ